MFFDIDGTLLSEVTGEVPASAKQALAEARSCGHLVFVNTGRAYSQLEKIRKMLDVDGWLCGCGTYVVAEGRELYYRAMPEEQRRRICHALEAADMDGILEGREGCYVGSAESRFPEGRHFRKSLAFAILSTDWNVSCGKVEKFCCIADDKSDKSMFFRSLGLDIQVIDRGDDFYECVPEGHSKATAIDVILKEYGLSLEDAYVFGDSNNDLSMFEHVPNAVAMGRHSGELEPYASFITKNVEQDGIWYAMNKLGLLRP